MSLDYFDDMIDPSAANPPMGLEDVKKLLDEADKPDGKRYFINGTFTNYEPDCHIQEKFGWSTTLNAMASRIVVDEDDDDITYQCPFCESYELVWRTES